MTDIDQTMIKELDRTDRKNIPVNIIYPADYPNRPAILLEENIWADDALEALERIAGNENSSSEVRVGQLQTTASVK